MDLMIQARLYALILNRICGTLHIIEPKRFLDTVLVRQCTTQ